MPETDNLGAPLTLEDLHNVDRAASPQVGDALVVTAVDPNGRVHWEAATPAQGGASVLPAFTDADATKALHVVGATNSRINLSLDENDQDGGTYTVTFDGDTTAPIAWDADDATATAAVEALPSIGSGNAALTALDFGTILIFIGAFAGTLVSIDRVTGDASGLEGATAPYSFDVSQYVSGGPLRLGWV